MGYDVKSGWNLPKGSGDVTHFPTEEEAEEYAHQSEIEDIQTL